MDNFPSSLINNFAPQPNFPSYDMLSEATSGPNSLADSVSFVDATQSAAEMSQEEAMSGLRDLDRQQLVNLVLSQKGIIHCLENRLNSDQERHRRELSRFSQNYNALKYRHKLKEIRIQDVMEQLKQFKDNQTPCYSRLRDCQMDVSSNRVFERMKEHVEECKTAKEEALHDMQAWTFTSESQSGKRLVARCKKLLHENEEFGKQVTSGNVAKLNAEIEMHKHCIQVIRKQEHEYDALLVEVDEELDTVTSLCKSFELKLTSRDLTTAHCPSSYRHHDDSAAASLVNSRPSLPKSDSRRKLDNCVAILSDCSSAECKPPSKTEPPFTYAENTINSTHVVKSPSTKLKRRKMKSTSPSASSSFDSDEDSDRKSTSPCRRPLTVRNVRNSTERVPPQRESLAGTSKTRRITCNLIAPTSAAKTTTTRSPPNIQNVALESKVRETPVSPKIENGEIPSRKKQPKNSAQLDKGKDNENHSTLNRMSSPPPKRKASRNDTSPIHRPNGGTQRNKHFDNSPDRDFRSSATARPTSPRFSPSRSSRHRSPQRHRSRSRRRRSRDGRTRQRKTNHHPTSPHHNRYRSKYAASTERVRSHSRSSRR